MDEQKFREWLDKVSEVLKVFVAAKKNKGQRFIDEINRLYSIPENKLKFQSLYDKYKFSEWQPVNVVRTKLLEKLISLGSISIDDVDSFQKEEAKKYKQDVFNSWKSFWILYALYYYFDDQKTLVHWILKEINSNLMNDAWIDEKPVEQAFDYNNHFWIDDFYMGMFNKTHESRTTATQFRIQSKWNNKLIVGLYKNRNFVKWKSREFDIDNITYQELLDELVLYKNEILKDNWVNLIEYIKTNVDKFSDVKEKAEEERRIFNEKFPLEKIKNLTLEEYNTWMWNANKWTFTWYLNTEYVIAWWLFSNGQNWLFYKWEDGKYTYAKNMKNYLDRWNWDYNRAFSIYMEDLYDFVKNFDVNTYNPKDFLDWAKYIKASLIFMYKWDIFLTLWLSEVCVQIAKHLNLIQWNSVNVRKVDIIEYDIMITDYLKKEIPDIIEKYWYSALGKCIYEYYTNYLYTKEDKTEDIKQESSINYYAIWADLWFWDRKQEFFNRWKLIIWWYEIWDLRQFNTDEELLQKYKECNFHDTETHFKQTFSLFKKIQQWDIVCVKSVHLQKKEMYIYAVWEVLQWYEDWYEYLDWLWHSLPVKWKIIEPRYTVDWAKYQKTLTKINDEEIKDLLDKLLWKTSSDNIKHLSSDLSKMIDLNTILYWVPGTGKTYNSVNYAVAIIENKSFEKIKEEPYEEIKRRYDEYQKAWQIVFTTFHQSFWYEDFIEWIKAEIKNNSVNYDVKPWIFKKLCDTARKNLEDSQKTIDELTKQNNIIDNIRNLLNESIEKWTKYKIKSWAEFYIEEYNDENIYIRNPQNEKADSILLKFNDLISLLSYENKITSSWEIVNILWYYTYTRQSDSYLFSLYNEYNKRYSESKQNISSEAVERKNYVIIIDEINRGNISKIFWELITLIEPNKRLWEDEAMTVKLPYSHDKDEREFWIPNNVYILWTMNTADRSIALMDLALRRRFKFKEIKPDSSLLEWIDVPWVDVKKLFEALNDRIEFLYDKDHLLWHALFWSLKNEPTLDKLNSIMLDNIIPLLQEYFHDDWEKIQLVLWNRIIEKKSIQPKDVWIDTTEYEEQQKYTVKEGDFTAEDYQY